MPPAEPDSKLDEREGDETLSTAELEKLQLFAQMKKRPNFKSKAGSIKLRRFLADNSEMAVICRQGEAGSTAFYLLTTEDLLELRRGQLESARAESKDAARLNWLERDVASLEQRAARLAEKTGANDRVAALARLAIGQKAVAPPTSLWGKLTRGLFGAAISVVAEERPRLIPVDGPSDIDSNSLQSPMREGDVFGEMSCLTRSPRSATVSVIRDWYVLEFTRDVLDVMQKDEVYKARMDQIYRERVLAGHLRRLSLFEFLTDAQFNELCGKVELLNFQPGEIVFDEHEPSDSIYVVRSGLVKVLKNVSSLVRASELTAETVTDFQRQFSAAAPESAAAKVLKSLAKPLLDDATDTAGVVAALNALIASATTPTALGKKLPEILKAAASPMTMAAASGLEDDPKAWSDLELRSFNRALLAALFPGTIAARAAQSGPRRTLAYLTRGDFLGEMGVMSGEARSATCVAFDHPDSGQEEAKGAGGIAPPRVELVKIDAATFHALAEANPALRARVQQVVAERAVETRRRVEAAPGEVQGQVQSSPRYEELGLFQGQKLMLIDLDRCTRCGDCVRACVNTHDDGRTRLYLDGPRFGRFLVPLTCRECLDPVCMIGCPVGAINRGDNGQIVIREWCIGCSLCAEQCPYGSIQMHGLFDWEKQKGPEGEAHEKDLSRAVVCDLCSSLPGQSPACVTHCPHDAAIRIEARTEISTVMARR